LAREVDTFGGRDLRLIEEELNRLSRRPLRDINDWGTVDVEALTMSIRSRLSTELSYALTTFTLLSTMRGQTPGSGFPIFQCADLLDELLDLLEDEAFGEEDAYKADILDDARIITHREMVNIVHDRGSELFAGLELRQQSMCRDRGPRPGPGQIVLAITNIIRNLSTIPDNLSYMAQQERLLDLMLRVCGVERSENDSPRPTSSILSLGDLINVRKDVLYTLTNLAGMIVLVSDPPSPTLLRMARRVFELISSFLVDPAECLSPLACVQQSGALLLNGMLKPPLFADIALEVFTRLSQLDSNRQVFSKAVPETWLMGLVKSLVHRMPVVDQDFQLATKELWLCYVEKTIMAMYSVVFLAPPELKRELKVDRSLGFTKVMLRMITKFLMNSSQDGRSWFIVCARRAIETLKVVDVAEDSFDTSKSAVPTMSFGMGYGEIGENGPEKGTGLLGGYRGLAWDMLMLREVDEVMFSELESLARIE
jgi:SWI/SNF chromatin-remodeling complex subunit SWI1